MEHARATWTDERLDDLSRRMYDGFNRVDEDLRSLRTELGGRIDAQGAQLAGRIERVEGRIDALQRLIIQVGVAVSVPVVATLVSVIATRG